MDALTIRKKARHLTMMYIDRRIAASTIPEVALVGLSPQESAYMVLSLVSPLTDDYELEIRRAIGAYLNKQHQIKRTHL